MLPKGIIIDCCCVLIGINIGSMIKNHIPTHIKHSMNIIFGIAAILIGIVSMIKLNSLPAVILALILGALLGEILSLDKKIRNFFQNILNKLNFDIPGDKEAYMHFYLLVTVTLCASGTNIFGAINEGITGDMTILLSKAVMDIFASVIFAATLGYPMNLIVIPQFIILTIIFYLSQFIIPFISPDMMKDFIAVGGILTFVLGLSIAQIKHISAINLLPALILIWPCSKLFSLII